MSRASGEGSWKIGRESIGRYFFGLNAEMEASEFSKTSPIHRLPSSPSSGFTVRHIYFTISPNKLKSGSSVLESEILFRISPSNISKSLCLVSASLFPDCWKSQRRKFARRERLKKRRFFRSNQ